MSMTDFFAAIPQIAFKGETSGDAFSYRFYDKNRIVAGKRMEDQLRLAACFWHGFCWPGADMFGRAMFNRPWLRGENNSEAAAMKRRTAFDFFAKLDVPFYCFHDVDVMAEAEGVAAHRRLFAEAVEHLAGLQAATGRRLLWGTANLFSHPRYAAGAATNPDPEVFAFARCRCVMRWRPHTIWAARITCCGAAAKATTRC
jgi:xylose isomerase